MRSRQNIWIPHIQKPRMKPIRFLHKVLSSFDFFPAQQFLRYRGEPEYKTATGGFCSLLIIVLFFILFVNAALSVLAKSTVSVSADTQHTPDPPLSTIIASPSGNFMFAVTVAGIGVIDNNNTNFSVQLEESSYSKLGTVGVASRVALGRCTLEHFSFNSETMSQYSKFNVKYWLCPPLGYQFAVAGSITSDAFRRFSIYIKKCNSTIYPNCAPDSKIADYLAKNGYFNAAVGSIGNMINPSLSTDYISTFVEDRNIFPFTTTAGVKATAEIEDFEIDTDVSLLPFSSIVAETGSYISELFQYRSIPVENDTYVVVHFEKSKKSVTYTRSFEKLDNFLSYVGGLVGLFLALFFILNSYSELAFEVSLAGTLFDHAPHPHLRRPVDSASFNFLVYLAYLAFRLCRFFGCCPSFPMMQMYLDCHEEIEKQIDISIILKRITTLQSGLASLLRPEELESLFFRLKPTLAEAKQLMGKNELYGKVRKRMQGKDFELREMQREGGEYGEDKYSDQSSFSSISSTHYKILRKRLKKLRPLQGGEADNKFMENMRKDIVRGLIEVDSMNQSCFERDEDLMGEDYFREVERERAKELGVGWERQANSKESGL